MSIRVAVLIGSLRKDSINKKIAHALIKLAPEKLDMRIVEIGDLPLFNEDLESDAPAAWTRFRTEMKQAQAALFVTPEYNRSVPASIRNALDVGSRPFGASVWGGKPAAIVTASPGATGGFGANHHLRQSLVFLDMPPLQQPEMYLSRADKMFDDKGEIVETTQAFLAKFMDAYTRWVCRFVEA
jgi:chromate reductase